MDVCLCPGGLWEAMNASPGWKWAVGGFRFPSPLQLRLGSCPKSLTGCLASCLTETCHQEGNRYSGALL